METRAHRLISGALGGLRTAPASGQLGDVLQWPKMGSWVTGVECMALRKRRLGFFSSLDVESTLGTLGD